MPIYTNCDDNLQFTVIEDYSEYSSITRRVVQLYSSDEEITQNRKITDIFAQNLYSYNQPDGDTSSVNFDMDYRNISAKYKAGTGFLIKKDKLITTIENIELLLQIPRRFTENRAKQNFMEQSISQGKLWCRRDYDNKDISVESVDDCDFDRGWIKLNLSDKFGRNDDVDMDDDADDIFADSEFAMKVRNKLQMFGHPLGSKKIFCSVGYVYDLMPKYENTEDDPLYKSAEAVLSFFYGSSGSPVFDENGVFIGICTETDRDNHFKQISSSSYELNREEISYDADPNKKPDGLLKIILKNRLRIL